VLHAHAQLIKLIPLLRQTNGTVFCVTAHRKQPGKNDTTAQNKYKIITQVSPLTNFKLSLAHLYQNFAVIFHIIFNPLTK